MIKIMVNSDPPALALESTYDQVSTPVGLGAASGSKVAWLATSLLASSADIKHSEPFCLVLAVEKRSPVVEMLQLWIMFFHSSLVALKIIIEKNTSCKQFDYLIMSFANSAS